MYWETSLQRNNAHFQGNILNEAKTLNFSMPHFDNFRELVSRVWRSYVSVNNYVGILIDMYQHKLEIAHCAVTS